MKPYYEHGNTRIYHGDVLKCLAEMPEKSVNCCVTSPPYWGLRDYGVEGQIGLEETPQEFVAKMVEVFRGVRRVLTDDGTCWVNMGDCYAGSGRGGNTSDTSGLEGTTESQEQSRKARGSKKPTVLHKATIESGAIGRAWVPAPAGLKQKDLCGMPWRLAFALQDDGWWLRQDIIWAKPNPMPESVIDRCTKAHEYIFLLSKRATYYYDQDAIREEAEYRDDRPRDRTTNKLRNTPGMHAHHGLEHNNYTTRNKRSVWEVATEPFGEAHFATFPTKLIEPCILAGCPKGGTVLDPFMGSGTTALVAANLQCKAVGIELNAEYIDLAARRLSQGVMEFAS